MAYPLACLTGRGSVAAERLAFGQSAVFAGTLNGPRERNLPLRKQWIRQLKLPLDSPLKQIGASGPARWGVLGVMLLALPPSFQLQARKWFCAFIKQVPIGAQVERTRSSFRHFQILYAIFRPSSWHTHR